MTKIDALKPCPFCGGAAKSVVNTGVTGSTPFTQSRYFRGYIKCSDCGATGPVKKNRASMMKAWNRRAALSEAEPAQTVRVKLLDWVENTTDRELWKASSPVGSYDLMKTLNKWVLTRNTLHEIGSFKSVEEATDAAQADYERRILSALTQAAEPVTDVSTGEVDALRAENERLREALDGTLSALLYWYRKGNHDFNGAAHEGSVIGKARALLRKEERQ